MVGYAPGEAGAGGGNVALLLRAGAARHPGADALIEAGSGARVSFGQLEEWSDRLAHGLRLRGLSPGSRALVLLRPGAELAAVTFALLKVGAVPVFVDPGLGWRHLPGCIAAAAPAALFAVRPALALRPLLPGALAAARLVFSSGWFPGATSLAALARLPAPAGGAPVEPAAADAPAIVAFTSGATGSPKGVTFTHRVLHAQVQTLRETWGAGEGSVQLAVLPLLALLGPGLGCCTVIPDMDPARPARADPRRILRALTEHRVTHAFGSPALWERVVRQARRAGLTLPDARAILVGGAPVAPELLRDLGELLPRGQAHVALGATEAVTVASAPGPEAVAAAGEAVRGLGSLVGRPVAGVEIRLVGIDDGPLPEEGAVRQVERGAAGEIAVRGPLVTAGYHRRPDADRLARIPAPGGDWHRMGDLGRFDDAGRLWFCGRKSERVETPGGLLLTACVEPLLHHPGVRRLALIGIGPRPAQRAAVVVEPRSGWTLAWPPARRRLAREILARACKYPECRAVERVLFRRALPLDPRHAAKILRGELSAWAERRAR